MDELNLAVVGIRYLNADGSDRRFEIELCRPGDAIELRPEPKHKLDSRAIGVWRAGGGQIGYLTAERCGWVGQRMASEETVAIYQGLGATSAFIRVRFGGGMPTLPAGATGPNEADDRASPEDGYYPDDDGPEFGA